MAKHVVAAVGDIPPGSRKLTHLNGRAIVVFNLGGTFYALNNRCPHRGGSLHLGIQTGVVQSKEPGRYDYSRRGELVKCPWHGWEFDIRTGQSYCDPKRFRARAYPVNVEPGSSVVKGPYIAETLAVSVESDYVVVDL